MNYAKHGLKALGLCLMAALGVMAFVGASAQAASWLESGVTITELLAIEIEKDTPHYILHSEAVGGTKVLILCSELKVKEGFLHPDGLGTGKLEFSTCATELNGAPSMVCLPKEPIVAKVKIDQFLHKHIILGKEVNEEFLLVLPTEGTKFTTISLNKEAGCSIGPNFEVTGNVIDLDCAHEPLVDKVKHLIEQVEGSLNDLENNKNSLKFGKFAAQILGSVWIKLTTGNTWAGHV